MLPHLLAERAPLWDPGLLGAFLGLRREHTRAPGSRRDRRRVHPDAADRRPARRDSACPGGEGDRRRISVAALARGDGRNARSPLQVVGEGGRHRPSGRQPSACSRSAGRLRSLTPCCCWRTRTPPPRCALRPLQISLRPTTGCGTPDRAAGSRARPHRQPVRGVFTGASGADHLIRMIRDSAGRQYVAMHPGLLARALERIAPAVASLAHPDVCR